MLKDSRALVLLSMAAAASLMTMRAPGAEAENGQDRFASRVENRLDLFGTRDDFFGAADEDKMEEAPAQSAGPEHAHLQRGESRGGAAAKTSRTASPLMNYYGGTVLHASRTKAIFWGPQWATASFAGDKITGLDSFFIGFSGSEYAATGDEYRDSTGFVTSASTYLGHTLDSSAAPRSALTTSSAVAEVCKLTKNKPDPLALYLIYTSTGAGNANYCAWHSWGQCAGGAKVQVAYMPNLDGVAGCNPGDTSTSHSEGLAAVANVTAHELMETITDPRGFSWMDSAGNEIGDKCAWSFPPVLSTFGNGSQWKLQMEWSNAAYQAGAGLPNLSGQKGCGY